MHESAASSWNYRAEWLTGATRMSDMMLLLLAGPRSEPASAASSGSLWRGAGSLWAIGLTLVRPAATHGRRGHKRDLFLASCREDAIMVRIGQKRDLFSRTDCWCVRTSANHGPHNPSKDRGPWMSPALSWSGAVVWESHMARWPIVAHTICRPAVTATNWHSWRIALLKWATLSSCSGLNVSFPTINDDRAEDTRAMLLTAAVLHFVWFRGRDRQWHQYIFYTCRLFDDPSKEVREAAWSFLTPLLC